MKLNPEAILAVYRPQSCGGKVVLYLVAWYGHEKFTWDPLWRPDGNTQDLVDRAWLALAPMNKKTLPEEQMHKVPFGHVELMSSMSWQRFAEAGVEMPGHATRTEPLFWVADAWVVIWSIPGINWGD
ncbi:uncharacterized protein SCHCODRAFT_02515794 [Schizophyllum commune H4-8]|nr:uncharacterized protein SCHCODRAFT_02500534 [Schizophyllum commune H4-8]XP_050197461.1 uncharacterized protein SCHCODRAFT_02519366 [Schizophyllum commune H4-8]XP_050198048.1 uncharacterized protein SCHCODRAFT_02515794 [Schizophyllum commune H4-8]KAI5886058.1 hypothetical protein SCHCODRAFT_02519366 [Schizophyllum commune H4-8]KAI5887363.1 hypothetical protein SCHCODRAFT_02515794 [Schizophyllum commune H4-8]KAI5893000.1 hypothetical protein SCHCODRAFT_02500534 [Schizophyllum commune H4-8]